MSRWHVSQADAGNVRFWPKADMSRYTAHVCFRGKADMTMSAFVVAIGGKADIAWCTAHVRF